MFFLARVRQSYVEALSLGHSCKSNQMLKALGQCEALFIIIPQMHAQSLSSNDVRTCLRAERAAFCWKRVLGARTNIRIYDSGSRTQNPGIMGLWRHRACAECITVASRIRAWGASGGPHFVGNVFWVASRLRLEFGLGTPLTSCILLESSSGCPGRKFATMFQGSEFSPHSGLGCR